MNLSLDALLLMLAFLFFVCAAIGVSSKVNLTAAGLALYVLSLLI